MIKGGTSHHHLVAEAAGVAIQNLVIKHNTPIINGIVVTEDKISAEERVKGPMDRGRNLLRRPKNGCIKGKMDDDLVINPKWSQRRQNRCAAFRFIFQWEMNSSEDFQQDLTEYFIRLEKGEEYFSYAIELIAGVMDKMEILDSIIRELVQNWEFSRIAKVELAMLRVALYELKYRLDVPPVVIIDEALEISKDFSTEDSRKFLNGVLDKAMLQMTRPTRKPAI